MQKKNLLKKALVALTIAGITLTSPMEAYATEEYGYTYNYDFWFDTIESPDLYHVSKVFTSADLGLSTHLRNPQGLFAQGNKLYLCDSGNNRILVLNKESAESIQVEEEWTGFEGPNGPEEFNNPTDVAISEEGNIFVADNGSHRVLKLSPDRKYLMQFDKPDDATLDKSLEFQPTKLVIDTAERMYCIASGINKGLVKYEEDGSFSGFIGATPVKFDFADYVWKKLASQEQRAKMQSFVPTEYDNIFIDKEGFIYACTGAVEDVPDEGPADAVRKLNLMGNNILVQNGNFGTGGDLYNGNVAGYDGPSYFTDITVLDNDIYICVDKKRGRIFGYDDQGHMVFACGGSGNMDGYFRRPEAIEHIGNELYVLDSLDCAITAMVPTDFGQTVYQAIDEFDQGDYEASGASWQKVMKENGNYDLAYIGIGRALMRQEKYKEALKYFELKYDRDNYSKAFKQYRKIWVEEHIGIIVFVILALFLVPMTIGRTKKVKHEIDTADIFNKDR
jgi:tetratricopeptide (TPR) repeat protein